MQSAATTRMHSAAPAACRPNRSSYAMLDAATGPAAASRCPPGARGRRPRSRQSSSLMRRCTATRCSSRVSRSGPQKARRSVGTNLQPVTRHGVTRWRCRVTVGRFTVNVARVHPTGLHWRVCRKSQLCFLGPAVQQRVSGQSVTKIQRGKSSRSYPACSGAARYMLQHKPQKPKNRSGCSTIIRGLQRSLYVTPAEA